MFKLVGKETFTVGGMETKATINIEAITAFAYEYSLEIDGKSLEKFRDNRAKSTKTWVLRVDGEDCRVVLGKPQEPQQLPTILVLISKHGSYNSKIGDHMTHCHTVCSGERL